LNEINQQTEEQEELADQQQRTQVLAYLARAEAAYQTAHQRAVQKIRAEVQTEFEQILRTQGQEKAAASAAIHKARCTINVKIVIKLLDQKKAERRQVKTKIEVKNK
jgi:N-acyl-L-homoserine lactone synthetase